METLIEIKTIEKQSHQNFDFFINIIEKEKDNKWIEEILGLPQIPLIGHYNGNDYSLGSVLSLICFQINCDDKNKIFSDFTLSKNIEEYLYVDEELEIVNHTKNKKLDNIFYPKKKLNFYLVISGLPYIISSGEKKDKKEKNDDKNLSEEKKIYEIYNMVPHLYYNKNKSIDFSETKRFVFEKAISLFDIDSESDKSDIKLFENEKFNISINDLRIEYSSMHLKKGSLAFSPNNLKFKLNITKPLSHFYLIINDKENEYHSVFYYITCNDDKTEILMKNILKKSNNIKDLIENIKTNFSNSIDIINNLNYIFK